MTDTPTLGTTTTGAPMELDVERLIGSHACIVANSGGGKSGLIRRLLEVTHGRVQHIVLDVEDEFYTLREHFDYVIAGGDDGDAPATVANAPGLARAALEHGFSLIAQINDLGDDAPAFVGAFLDSLMSAPRELWRPLLVVIDETQRFAPVTGSTEATAGVKALVQRGRKRGFTGIFASLALSEINPRLRGLVNNWMLGRVGQSLDRDTMARQLGFRPSSDEARGLQALEPRTFWGFGPALTPIPTLFRVSDVETTPVRPGQAKVPTPPPPEALRAILQGLAKVEVPSDPKGPADARDEFKSDDALHEAEVQIGYLQADVARLTAELAKWREKAERQDAGIRKAVSALGYVSFDELDQREADAGLKLANATIVERKPLLAPPPRREERAAPPKAPRPASGAAPIRADGEAATLPKPLQKIVDAVAWWTAFGIADPRAHQVAYIAGYASTSGTWDTYRSRLRSQGLIDIGGGRIRLTEAGAAVANGPLAVPTVEELHAAVREKLATPLQKFLDVLLRRYPNTVTSAEWASEAGYEPSSGTADTYRSRIMSLDLAERPKRGYVRAADWLFP